VKALLSGRRAADDDGGEFGKSIEAETEKWAKTIQAANIRLE
jgi:hypothetical protein